MEGVERKMDNFTQTEKCGCLCYDVFYDATGTAKTIFKKDVGIVTVQKDAVKLKQYLNVKFDRYIQA